MLTDMRLNVARRHMVYITHETCQSPFAKSESLGNKRCQVVHRPLFSIPSTSIMRCLVPHRSAYISSAGARQTKAFRSKQVAPSPGSFVVS